MGHLKSLFLIADISSGDIVGIIIFFVVVVIGIIVGISSLKDNKRKQAKFEEIKNKWKEQGFNPKFVSEYFDILFMVDEENDKWGTNDGEIYDISNIQVADILRVKSNDINKVYDQYIFISYRNSPNGNQQTYHEPIYIGKKEEKELAYKKNSVKYREKEQILHKILVEIKRLIEKNKCNLFNENKYIPSEEKEYNCFNFSYDLENKKFSARANSQGQTIYDFSDFIDYKIKKDVRKYEDGYLFSYGGIGTLNKTVNEICYDFTLIIKVKNIAYGVEEIEYHLLDNGLMDTKSEDYRLMLDFSDNVCSMLKYIEKQNSKK